MHRSGTSLVVRMLASLGLYVGETRDENDEAIFFRRLNDWILLQSGASWDNPMPTRYLIECREARSLAVDYLRFALRAIRAKSYLGWISFLRHRDLARLSVPWGWKDPRNTFTLPLWLDVFPDARVVCVRRHGVDVAYSLKVRHESILRAASASYPKWRPTYLALQESGRFTSGLRCSTLEGAFSLWEEYVGKGYLHVRELGQQAIEFKYEDLLERPAEIADTLVDFCHLSPTRALKGSVLQQVDRSRAFAYRRQAGLRMFAEGVEVRLQRFGYSA